ncbi:putative exopolyphosphatase [Mycobacterium kansasii]|uniref:Putative exopolyphosphatase n=1 Tax=Mycobacterium kansasii TaxID=1768 RepID=A0A1V3XQP5_MYCKA|nr:putative exopolyphosphatase [Mycobacterium kansasii]
MAARRRRRGAVRGAGGVRRLGLSAANRLDRLHVRYDLSWQALDGALARRAVVARAVAIEAYGDTPEGRRLADLADAAECAPRQAREAAENELSAALEVVDPPSLPTALAAELADAEARVVLARRFHNDAVRDTLVLRERRMVRAFRLGGRAPLPTYFEIAERPHALVHGGRGDHSDLIRRTSARLVLLDETGAVLLLRGSDPAAGNLMAPRCLGGGSPSAVRCATGSSWLQRLRGSWPRKPACRSSRPTWSAPSGDATTSSSSTARCSTARSSTWCTARSGLSRPSRAEPSWSAATFTVPAGAAPPRSRS